MPDKKANAAVKLWGEVARCSYWVRKWEHDRQMVEKAINNAGGELASKLAGKLLAVVCGCTN